MVYSADSSSDSIKFNRKKIFATRFPTFKATLLNNTTISLPDHYQGKPTVIYLAGPKSNQSVLDSWSHQLRKLFPTDVHHLELLFPKSRQPLANYCKQLQPLIAPELHSIVGLSHLPFNHLQKSLLLYAEDFVFVFVLDKQGHIIFSQPGACSEFQLFRIKNSIKNILNTDEDKLKVDGSHLNKKRKALVFGGTGLVGSCLIDQLLQDSLYTQVIMAVRSPSTRYHPKLSEHIVDFDCLDEYNHLFNVDDVFCCLGTTLKQATSKAAQKKVDLDYPKAIAKCASAAKSKHFILVSSLGASSGSKSFYLGLKGQLEDYITTLQFDHVFIFRPSVLLGLRKSFRMGEYILKLLLLFLSPFLIGPLSKYKPISAMVVAKSMIVATKQHLSTCFFHYKQMQSLAKDKSS